MLRLIMSEAVLPVCPDACKLFKAKTVPFFYFAFKMHGWIDLISIFFICAFYVSPWVSLLPLGAVEGIILSISDF